MADPIIRIKRSSVEGKIPTPDQLPIGEVALNTFDGKFYASKNVGIGTTVFAVNPWTVGTGTNTYNTFFTAGNVGVGSTLPSSKLDVVGDAKFTGIVTSIDGRLISGIGINTTGGNVGYSVTTIDFRGSGISAVTVFSGIATINITGDSGGDAQTPGRVVTSYTATAGINTYNVTYEVGYLDAFLNGSRLSSTEYTATNGTSIILNEGPSEGDALDLIYYTLGVGSTGPQGPPGEITNDGVGIQSGGTLIGYGITTLNFIGTGNTFAVVGDRVDISISGSGGGGGSSSQWVTTSVGIHTLSKVGIGTTNPTSLLTVAGNTLITGIATISGNVSLNGNVTLGDNTSDDISVNGEFVTNLIPNTNNAHDLGSSTQKWRDLWIAATATAADFNTTSDLTLKTDISSISNPLDKVIQINGVEFTWKENGKKSAGVIAQEVEKVFPNLVSDGEIKTVNYNGLIGLLIEVVKDQQKQIDKINNKLKSLEINI